MPLAANDLSVCMHISPSNIFLKMHFLERYLQKLQAFFAAIICICFNILLSVPSGYEAMSVSGRHLDTQTLKNKPSGHPIFFR